LGFALLLTASGYFVSAAMEIGNYALAMALLAGAVVLLCFRGRDPRAAFAAALLIGLAGSVKLNFILYALLLLDFVLGGERSTRAVARRAAIATAGGALGAASILYHLAAAPSAFLLYNVTFHTELTNAMRGLDGLTSLLFVLRGIKAWIVSEGLGFALIAVGLAVLARRAQDRDPPPKLWERVKSFFVANSVLAMGLAVSLIAPATVGTIFTQYLIPLTFFAALLLLRHAQHVEAGLRVRGATALTLVLVLVFSHRGLLDHARIAARLLVDGDGGAMAAVGRINRALARVKTDSVCGRKVFSYAGHLVVDSGYALTRESGAGQFWARLRGHVPEHVFEDPALGVSRKTVYPETGFEAAGTRLFVTGYHESSPHVLAVVRFAEDRGYDAIELGEIEGRPILLRSAPECHARGPTQR
jgi:hypothetical protein